MSAEMIGLIGIVVLIASLLLKIWIGAAMAIIGIVGFAAIEGFDKAFIVAGAEPYSTIASYIMSTLPLFIFMGEIVSNAEISQGLYNAAYNFLGRLPGGLAVATTAACAAFAAICGSSMATAITMGKVAIPEMDRYHYDSRLSSGCAVAGGTIGVMIPPSLGFIIYGLLTDTSIGKLFMAGIIPGILQAIFYISTILIWCRISPQLGPAGPRTSLKAKITSLKGIWAMLFLFLLVMGGIYMGIFTPTEAGAVGAFGAIVISFVSRRLTWSKLRDAMVDTAQTTAMMGFLIVGAFILMRFIAVSKLPLMLSDIITGFNVPPMIIMLVLVIFYIICGCIMDVMAAVLLTISFVFPLVQALGFDPVWFGVILVRLIEIGMITPPVGLNVFVLSGAINVPVGTIFRGVIPFVLADFFHVALLIAVPVLSLYIPNSM